MAGESNDRKRKSEDDIKENKKKKHKRQRKNIPRPGEEGYKTPTQLRNARKRQAKKKNRAQKGETGGQQKIADPSSMYLSNPKSAPVVRRAKKFFQNRPFEVHVGPTKGWRTVAKLAVRPSGSGEVSIGLFAPNSHDLIPVPDCVAHHPSINCAVVVLEQICNQNEVTPFDEKSGKGFLRHVAINVERATGKVQMTLVWNAEPYAKGSIEEGKNMLDKLVKNLVAIGGSGRKRRRGRKKKEDFPNEQDTTNSSELKLHSLWVHYNGSWKHTNAIFNINGGSDCWEHRYGPDYLEETLSIEGQEKSVALAFPPNVFRQANLDAFSKIVSAIRRRVMSYAKTRKELPTCVELYGGVGTIGLNVADLFKSIVSSDENPFNKRCFEEAAKNLTTKASYESKNAADMVQTGILNSANVVVMDPPRKGLDEITLKHLCEAEKPELLVYVSCGFHAFERDYNALVASKWQLDHAEGHLLFPGSDAIETLVFFSPQD